MFSLKVFGKREKKTGTAALDVAKADNSDPVKLLASNEDTSMNEELLEEASKVIKALKPDSLPKELAKCHMVIIAAKKVIAFRESYVKEMVETHKRITAEKDKQIEVLAKHGDSNSPTAFVANENNHLGGDLDLFQEQITEFKGDNGTLRKCTKRTARTEMIDKSIQTSYDTVRTNLSFMSSQLPDLSSGGSFKPGHSSERDVKGPMLRRWHSLNRAVEPIRKKKQKLFARLTSRFEESSTASAWEANSSKGNTDVTMNKRVLQAEEAFWKVQGELEALRKKMNENERWEEQVHAQVVTIAEQRSKIDALRAKLQGFKLESPQKKVGMELNKVEEFVMIEQSMKVNDPVEIKKVRKIEQSMTVEEPANIEDISKINKLVKADEPAEIKCNTGASQSVETEQSVKTELPVGIEEPTHAENDPDISESVAVKSSDKIEHNAGNSQPVEAEQSVKTEEPIKIKELTQAEHCPSVSESVEVELSDETGAGASQSVETDQPVETDQSVETVVPVKIKESAQDEHSHDISESVEVEPSNETGACASQPVETDQSVKTELPVEIKESAQAEPSHDISESVEVEPSDETELLKEVSKTPSNQMLGAGENMPVSTKGIDDACLDHQHVEDVKIEEN